MAAAGGSSRTAGKRTSTKAAQPARKSAGSASKATAAKTAANKAAPAAKTTAKRTSEPAGKPASGRAAAARKAAPKPPAKKPTAKPAAKPAAKAAPKTANKAPAPSAERPAAAKGGEPAIAKPRNAEWTKAELRAVRKRLVEQMDHMTLAYDRSISELNDLQLSGTDSAGDDQADAGNKTFEREQEQSIAANRADLLAQMRRAVERIDAGTYGFCESCGKPIPKARLQAFPSATLDVACKSREERR